MDVGLPELAQGSEAALRNQLTNLLSVLMLSIRMTESRDQRKILELAATSVPSLVDCRVDGAYLEAGGWSLTSGTLTEPEARADVEGQFAAISDAGGAVSIQGVPWAWAFPLRSLAGTLGFLLIGADEPPPSMDQFVLRALAQQVGIAIANARLHHRQLAASADLRTANARLAESLEAIRRRAEIHERLTRAAMTGTGLVGIVEAIHELTGYPIVVEDRAGNVIAHAGSGQTGQPARPFVASSEGTIRRAVAAGGPVREPGRVVVIANPSDGAAGLMSLLDPEGTAGEPEIVALEHGATVVGMELARLRRLGDAQLRLRRDLLDDILAGIDPHVTIERAGALGCDLLQPRRIAVVVADGGSSTDGEHVIAAVNLALRDHPVGWLVTAHGGAAIVLADAETDWQAFHASVARTVDVGCRVGVGGPTAGPADVARSLREARLALKMGDSVGRASTATVFDDLGVFRLFADVEDTATVERFARSWLGKLLDYDAKKPAELVPTLSRFLDVGQAYGPACAALAIHRSTLKYRLQRIREISGHDLADPDTRFNLQLAARAWGTLQAMRESDRAAGSAGG